MFKAERRWIKTRQSEQKRRPEDVKEKKPWHEDDAFWETVAPVLFYSENWELAAIEVDDLIHLAGIEDGAAVLDLCCGEGRHSLELARRGFRVTAVDITSLYLERAGARAEKEGLRIEFVQADMREFLRRQAFDVIINLFTSFGFFDDPAEDRRVLENIHASLKPGGVLVVQTMGKEVLARIFQARNWREADGHIVLQEASIERDWGWVVSRWIILSDGEVKEFTVEHRLYSAVELRELLIACGFASVEIFGDLSGSPYDNEAERLIAVARR
jgi:2-polyprenyl-3-methyl-5-hydroxy-6-metoxy-1,4-benzoquinol methylase